MKRKILAGALIGVSSLVLAASLVGIILAWVYNEPLTDKALTKLKEIDSELQQVQTVLADSKTELENTLQTVNDTEQAINQFTQNDPQGFFEDVQTTLDEELIPELGTAKERLLAARNTLSGIRSALSVLKYIPFVKIDVPDQTLTDLIDSADSLQAEIANVSGLAKQASSFLDDASALLGGDLGQTRATLEYFLKEIDTYQQKVTDWRKQVTDLIESIPVWLDRASLSITVVLFWLGFSQLGLLLHGLTIWQGGNPLVVLKRNMRGEEREIGNEE